MLLLLDQKAALAQPPQIELPAILGCFPHILEESFILEEGPFHFTAADLTKLWPWSHSNFSAGEGFPFFDGPKRYSRDRRSSSVIP